ncbi:hypothetical protein CVT25_000080 [Psilocybe cyanescens]|uniref:Uncharacterized protein n=1 Tax=Psilocybe cyanescens TaxID=93625 RepID=A0A409XEF9_PSICY|nr:hypothetical protein CVT25_000080 [Psilocybe cyanescens]
MEFSSLIVKPGKRSATRESSTIPDIAYLLAQRRSKPPETIQHSTMQRRASTPKRVAFNEDMNVDSSDSQSGDEEDEEDELESGSKLVKLIPKPKGEAGRPGSGGYDLQEELAWSERTYEAVVNLVHDQAKKKHLDLSKSYSKQNKKLVKEICDEVKKEYRVLDDYNKHWPVHDMLKLHLKYTSEAARRRS